LLKIIIYAIITYPSLPAARSFAEKRLAIFNQKTWIFGKKRGFYRDNVEYLLWSGVFSVLRKTA